MVNEGNASMENLKDIPLFSSLSQDDGERYGKSCLWKDYEAHELVIDIDEETTLSLIHI